jgi:hypothetical protein
MMPEPPPIWVDQKSILAEYRRVFRERCKLDGQPDTRELDHQLSWLRQQMTAPTRLAASQYERAFRRAA